MASAERIVEWLEESDAIRLGESPWRTVADDEDVFLIDWKQLFPSGRPRASRASDWELLGDEWAFAEDVAADDDPRGLLAGVREALETPGPSEAEGPGIAQKLQWDACAWYHPMHYHRHDWGIFIRQDCIREHAIQIARFLPAGTPFSPSLVKALVRAGFAAMFLHEQFHHKVESLAIRLHIVERSCRYVPYQNGVYRPTYGSDNNLEEALANADACLRVRTSPYATWMGGTVVAALQAYLRWRYPFDPPGYRMAPKYLTNTKLDRAVDLLHGQVQEALVKPKRPTDEWEIATRLHQSLFKVTDHLWEVVPRSHPRPMLPCAKPYPSISSTQLVRLAEKHGWAIRRGAGKGSHIRMERSGAPSLTIPANRRDVSPGVIETTLRAFGGYKLNDLGALLHRL
jgi:predicted RNA binding protein YcfA (HicA-like mRNA interferase family)